MARPSYLFWLDPIRKMIWQPFWWVFLMVIILWVPFLRVWWWVFFPLMMAEQLKVLYLWWLGWDFDYAKAKWVILEIIPPKELLTPIKAMDDVFTAIWPIYDHPVFRERWCDGEHNELPFWFSWEIVSLEGQIHFYLRCLAGHRLMIETSLYAHYPDLEIVQAQDYVKLVPPTAPNDEWDAYGEDFIQAKDIALPIKTYEKFFEPQGEKIQAEEKRIDPLAALLEAMARLGKGEYYWMQFITIPTNIDLEDKELAESSKKIVNQISKRPEKKTPTFFEELMHVFYWLVHGPEKEGSGDGAKYSWLELGKTESDDREMVLTPGEREILTEVENKVKKPIYRVVLRGMYVAKRESWKSAHRIIARSYFSHFNAPNMNFIKFDGRTRPKVHNFMRNRRVFLRARKIFRNAVLRFPTLFPNRDTAVAVLNTEELATVFHFPIRTSGMIAPTMSRVESKKSGPPQNLPIE